MNDFIDIYCERTGPEFWAEPLNAISNIAFFIAAFAALYLARKKGGPDRRTGILIALIFIIGAGSFLFHTFATAWAQASDTIPILLYQVVFLYLYGRDIIGLKKLYALRLVGGFFITIFLFAQLPQSLLNGSISYLPALLFVGGLGVYHWKKGKNKPFTLLCAAAFFTVSLTFRSLDMAVCSAIPAGLHYFWHGLNGAVLYLTARAYILNTKS